MNTLLNKSDIELKADVLSELAYEPSVVTTRIEVLVENGIVTLSGCVANYGENWDIVHAAKRVAGVKAVADEILVDMPELQYRSDVDIAGAAVNQLDWSTRIPKGSVEVTVRDGQIILEGKVEWWYQKDAADNAVVHLAGVKKVTNLVTIKPKLTPSEVVVAIQAALERNAIVEAKKIHVESEGNKVVLRGKVRNYAELEEAERIAWGASGILSVDNQLKVEWSWGFLNNG